MNKKKLQEIMRKISIEENEFLLICDMLKGVILNLTFDNYKNSFISNLEDALESGYLEVKCEVNSNILFNKIYNLNYKETLELLCEVDNFWQQGDEHYMAFRRQSPRMILNTLN